LFAFLTIVCVAGIAGWATVTAARSLGGRGSDDLELRLEDLIDAVAGLRADLDEMAAKQTSDRELLEERLDFTERLLTRGQDEERKKPGLD
jgi:hypothetical protein